MVRHIIIWDLKDELTEEQKREAAERIKNELEALKGQIEGLEGISVIIDTLPTSNGDIMLDSSFADRAALGVYAMHPLHVAVKDYIGTVVKSRKCVDYEA